MDLTGGLAKQVAALPAEMQPVMTELLNQLDSEVNAVVGGVLADITAERTELVGDLHGILDRLNGTRIIIGDATGVSPYGFTLKIPERTQTT